MKRAQQGDRAALQRIVEKHAPWMFRLACSLNSSVEDAEDILQDTFLAVTLRLNSFKERSSLKTWLSGILVKQTARHRRYRKIRRTLSLDTIFSKQDEGYQGGAWKEAETMVDDPEMRLDLETMLSTLTPEHREILVLRELQGFSYGEIAGVLDLPVGTVESRLFRARRDIRRRFDGYFSGEINRKTDRSGISGPESGRNRND